MGEVSFFVEIGNDEFSGREGGDVEEVGILEVGGELFVVGPRGVHVDGEVPALGFAVYHDERSLKALEAAAVFTGDFGAGEANGGIVGQSVGDAAGGCCCRGGLGDGGIDDFVGGIFAGGEGEEAGSGEEGKSAFDFHGGVWLV